jgi:nitrite reductase/ring-hydroxylating ferredoxin subunit
MYGAAQARPPSRFDLRLVPTTLGSVVAQIIRVEGGAALAERACVKFRIDDPVDPREGFLLRVDGTLLAFENRCPHWEVDLDLGLGDPYLADLDRIFCRNHAAVFDPATGRCESGPPLGRSIRQFPVTIRGSDVFVEIAPFEVP